MKPYGGQKSHNTGAKKRYSIVSRFLTTSFTTSQFRWIHEEGWEKNALFDLMPFLTHPPLGINKGPSHRYSKNRTQQIFPIGAWALYSSDGSQCLGLVKAVGLFGSFLQIHLHTSLTDSQDLCSDTLWMQALSYLISAIFIGSECDVIKIFSTLRSLRDCHEDSWKKAFLAPNIKRIWTPLPTLVRLALMQNIQPNTNDQPLFQGRFIDSISIDPMDWWSSEFGQKTQKELHYLVARKTSEKDRQKQQKSSPRKSRWTKFLRW